jgi:multicomponent Na+:H+ antiporter subunit D
MSQNEFRRILSFHIISQVGYMIMGLGLYTPLAIAGAIFYIVHHIIVKTNLFLVSGVARQLQGSFELDELGGLSTQAPWLTALFAVSAFSLAGIPPLSGFWAKLILVKTSLGLESYLIAGTALGVGLLTLFSMAKIWGGAFWGNPPAKAAVPAGPTGGARNLFSQTALYLPMFALVLLTLTIGLMPEPFMDLARQAADQLMHPSGYVRAVMKGAP